MKKRLRILSGIFLAVCLSVSAFAQTAGTLTFSFTPAAKSPGYEGTKNYLAVWIQTNTGAFVKAKLRYASKEVDHLPTYAVNSGGTAGNCTATACNKTDATTGATLASFTAKKITWDGKNVNGTANGTTVADGVYKITIEECWNHGTTGTVVKSYTFTKGPNPDHQTPASDANFSGVVIDWLPASTTGIDETNSENPEIAVYPNPSTNGIFNVDFNKASDIKIINTLGIVVYNEKVDQAGSGTRSIDLSNFANGIYMINVIDGNASSNYKVILNK